MSKEGDNGQFSHWKNIPNNREQLAKMLGTAEAQPVFTKQDTAKLKQFKDTVSAASRAEGMLANGQKVPVVEVGVGGQITKTTLDKPAVSKMKHAAFDLYANHLYPDSKLRHEANTIAQTEKQKTLAYNATIPEVKQLETIWELPTYKNVGQDVDDEERAPK